MLEDAFGGLDTPTAHFENLMQKPQRLARTSIALIIEWHEQLLLIAFLSDHCSRSVLLAAYLFP